METACSPETLMSICQATMHHIPQLLRIFVLISHEITVA